jgi:hypothetical protein
MQAKGETRAEQGGISRDTEGPLNSLPGLEGGNFTAKLLWRRISVDDYRSIFHAEPVILDPGPALESVLE